MAQHIKMSRTKRPPSADTSDVLRSRCSSFEEHAVIYPDGSGLARPIDLPRSNYHILFAIAIVAAVLGGVWVFITSSGLLHDDARQTAEIIQSLESAPAKATVRLSACINQDSQTIRAALAADEINTIDITAILERDTNAIDLIKVPADMDSAAFATAYAQGLESMRSSEAVKILADSWRLHQESEQGVDLHLHYADLTAQSADDAIDAALEQQGFDANLLVESGVDDKGNTFRVGSVEVDATSYTWTVSVCPLKEVYHLSGLPENAQYVGIHLCSA